MGADKKLRKSSVLTGAVLKHSVKPTVFHEQIEALYPDLSKIELFSRAARPGWKAWGNQADSATNT
jgi:N6-adenosine-specific RNA methylase IME4